jgi:hypothetical protein
MREEGSSVPIMLEESSPLRSISIRNMTGRDEETVWVSAMASLNDMVEDQTAKIRL